MCPVRISLAFRTPDLVKARVGGRLPREKAASTLAAFCYLEPIGSGVTPAVMDRLAFLSTGLSRRRFLL
jgi:hypothetical protein